MVVGCCGCGLQVPRPRRTDVASLSSKGQTRRKAGTQSYGPLCWTAAQGSPGCRKGRRINCVGAATMSVAAHGWTAELPFSEDKRANAADTIRSLARLPWQGPALPPLSHFFVPVPLGSPGTPGRGSLSGMQALRNPRRRSEREEGIPLNPLACIPAKRRADRAHGALDLPQART
jgi:hypothetical protein